MIIVPGVYDAITVFGQGRKLTKYLYHANQWWVIYFTHRDNAGMYFPVSEGAD